MKPVETPAGPTAALPVDRSVPLEAAQATSARHVVLGITFVIAFIMYIDRAVIGTAAPMIMKEFGLSKIAMGWSASAFNWTYALLQVPGGWLADRYGPRIVLAGAMIWWSVFTALTGLATGAVSLTVTRGLFGVGESAAFPSSSRALVPWLPRNRRAFGQGFQHAGARFGAAVAPALVVFMIARFDWRTAFYILGVVGVVWSFVWYAYYRNSPLDHPGVNAAERELLSDVAAVEKKKRVPWESILRSRDLWYLSVLYFCYGWVLWMYLTWLPTYLIEARGFTQLKVGIFASLPLLAATVTNGLGGWLSDKLTERWGLRRGRITVSMAGFLIAASALVPGVLASNANTAMLWLVIALADLELTVAVSWAICIDIGERCSGSVSGVMNTVGNLGGAAGAVGVGYIATILGWTACFIVASGFCVIAALLATRINPSRSAVA